MLEYVTTSALAFSYKKYEYTLEFAFKIMGDI